MVTEAKRMSMKEWRLKNREKIRAYNREWLRQNKEENAPKAAIRNARWYKKGQEQRDTIANGLKRYASDLPCKHIVLPIS